MKNKIFITSLLFIILMIGMFNVKQAISGEVYYPYPIIFVHGLNSSEKMWEGVKLQIENKFFRFGLVGDQVLSFKYDYHTYGMEFFGKCDYENATKNPDSEKDLLDNSNNGNIEIIAKTVLKPSIDNALASFPSQHDKIGTDTYLLII